MAYGELIGAECKLYHSAALTGEPSTGSWTEITCRDLTLNQDAAEANLSTRANRWSRARPTMRNASVEFEITYDPDDTCYTALRDAFINGTKIALAVMDGDIAVAGNQGFAGNFGIFGLNVSQPLEGEVTVAVTAKPWDRSTWYTVAS